jgi:hypothetical protein
MPLNLPNEFEFDLPDLQQLAQGAIGSAESGYAPGTTIARTTDAKREEDARTYREQMNSIANLKDGVKLVRSIVDAGVEYTQLGRSIIKYKTGLENIRTEGYKLQKAQTNTAIAQTELQELQSKLNYHNQRLPLIERGYTAQIQALTAQAGMAERQAEMTRIEAENRYPIINVDAIRPAA